MEILPLSSIEVTCVRHPSRSNGPSHHGVAVAVDRMETSMQLRRRRGFIVNLDIECLYECNGEQAATALQRKYRAADLKRSKMPSLIQYLLSRNVELRMESNLEGRRKC
jgi:hypothetical protein